MTIPGSCLCQEIKYEIDGELLSLGHCHCKMCQRFHGTAYATYGMILKADFSISQGEASLRTIQSSQAVKRKFCSKCGSPISYENSTLPENIWIAAGTFDGDPQYLPQYHIFVGSKAAWLEINDDLPQYEGLPPSS